MGDWASASSPGRRASNDSSAARSPASCATVAASTGRSAAGGASGCDRHRHPRSVKGPHPMSATKILWGQIVVVFLIMLAAVWSATQWTAAALAYQPELGAPWFSMLGWRVYPPPAFFWWWFSFDAYAPRI